MNIVLHSQLSTPKHLLASLLHTIASLTLVVTPILLSLGVVNRGLCAEKKSGPNIVVILADDKYKYEPKLIDKSSINKALMTILC
jgi:hypothetical protein